MVHNSQSIIQEKTAVVLFQLGGPDSPEAVEPFLYNLFMDPDIIDFPLAFLAQRPLAKYISARRSVKARENYELNGGKSPILNLTRLQAKALQEHLAGQGIDVQVFVAMRYCHPSIEEVAQDIKSGDYGRIILLPLYPQFSGATTRSSMKEWDRQVKKYGINTAASLICCYPNHRLLLEAFVDNINLALSKFNNISPADIDLVFSAHGVPVSYIRKGDPYKLHIEETVRSILALGKWKLPHTLCYQSKVGPLKWLEPSLIETVDILARKGRKYMLIAPISFVTDHIETLYEIDIELRKHAARSGICRLELMPALNDHPKFIDCLAELVKLQYSTDARPRICDLWEEKKDLPEPKMCPWRKVRNK